MSENSIQIIKIVFLLYVVFALSSTLYRDKIRKFDNYKDDMMPIFAFQSLMFVIASFLFDSSGKSPVFLWVSIIMMIMIFMSAGYTSREVMVRNKDLLVSNKLYEWAKDRRYTLIDIDYPPFTSFYLCQTVGFVDYKIVGEKRDGQWQYKASGRDKFKTTKCGKTNEPIDLAWLEDTHKTMFGHEAELLEKALIVDRSDSYYLQ